ncbi:MAG: hypothetical protein AB7F65_02390 [Dehalococcoidia bacterium]
MLRVILVAGPERDQLDAVAEALASTPLSALYTPRTLLAAGQAVADRHAMAATPNDQLYVATTALDVIRNLAEREEGTVALLAAPSVVREVIVYALDAPVPEERLAVDPGTIAEVEVRTDAPWTVNRINDACHLPASA